MTSGLRTAIIGLLTATAGMILPACVDRGAASRFANLPENGWAYGDTVSFVIERPDSLTPGRMNVAVTNTNSFPYSNLWLEVTTSANGCRLRCDTVNIQLADVYGRWTGKGFGPAYQTEVNVVPEIVPQNGTTVSVRHIMRLDTVRGINQIGISITPL